MTPDREGKFIAVANMKGGVGKTTTVVSLAETLSASKAFVKVLIIDLDPQASASVAMAGDDELTTLIKEGKTLEAFLEHRLIVGQRPKIADYIHHAICKTTNAGQQLDVSLLACGPELRKIERAMIIELAVSGYIKDTAYEGRIARMFRTDIQPLSRLYDYIIFDCAPGISPVTEVAIKISDLVIVPTIPDRLSAYGLNTFVANVWENPKRGPKSRPHVLVVRKNNGIRQHIEVHDELIAASQKADAEFVMMTEQLPTCAPLVTALMMDGYPTFSQKYTRPVIDSILIPLANEVRRVAHGT